MAINAVINDSEFSLAYVINRRNFKCLRADEFDKCNIVVKHTQLRSQVATNLNYYYYEFQSPCQNKTTVNDEYLESFNKNGP